MRSFLWIGGGIVLVSAAFFISGGAEQIWQSLLFSGIAATVFIIALVCYYPADSKRGRTGFAMAVLLVLLGIYGVMSYQESQKQKRNLADIRETIEAGIAKNYINEMLLETLRTYYASDSSPSGFGAIFQSKYDSLITERMIDYNPSSSKESLSIELAKASADSVVLVAYSSFVPGKNVDFKNYSGNTGRMQSKGILTAKGIEYEREN